VKKALISGITGQDGSYLAEFLLGKGYAVYGIIRRSSSFNTGRIDPIYEDPHVPHRRLHLVYGDLNDASSLNRIIRTIQPDEIYNLGAQSHVRVSFDIPEYTGEITGLGTIRLLEAIRESGLKPKFYQASSSEMFGKVQEVPQCETTPFYPRSPYGAAKVYSYWITVNYREAYDLFACNGILFNHESPRRGETFVTRKITKAAARIKLGLQTQRAASTVPGCQPGQRTLWLSGETRAPGRTQEDDAVVPCQPQCAARGPLLADRRKIRRLCETLMLRLRFRVLEYGCLSRNSNFCLA